MSTTVKLSAKTRVYLVIAADVLLIYLVSRLSAMLAISLAFAQVLTQVASFDTTIFLHRYLTHGAITWMDPKLIAKFKFRIWLLTGIDWDEWVAVHKKHHAFTDVEDDPHSPRHPRHITGLPNWLEKRLPGWLRVQVFNVFYYAGEAADPETVKEYAPHIQRHDGIWGKFPFSVGIMGPILGTIVLCLLVGTLEWTLVVFKFFDPTSYPFLRGIAWGFFTGGAHMILYIGGSGSVNSLCHTFGTKNFDNTATNVPEVAALTAGEGSHNNHHAYPRSAKFSARGNEMDLAWPVILRMKKRGKVKLFESAIAAMHAKAGAETFANV